MRSMFVSRSSFEKPRPLERCVRTTSPSSVSTTSPRCSSSAATRPAIVDWDAKRVEAYIAVNEIPYNPLHDAGYPSIGCIPCTRPVLAGEDERAGRWSGSDKLECGIHGNTRLVKESND